MDFSILARQCTKGWQNSWRRLFLLWIGRRLISEMSTWSRHFPLDGSHGTKIGETREKEDQWLPNRVSGAVSANGHVNKTWAGEQEVVTNLPIREKKRGETGVFCRYFGNKCAGKISTVSKWDWRAATLPPTTDICGRVRPCSFTHMLTTQPSRPHHASPSASSSPLVSRF